MGAGAPGRTWLISGDEIFVLQIQDNLFMRNWRKRDAPYPHFDSLHDEFWTDFGNYRNMLAGEGLTPPSVRQLEVSYINWIPQTDLSSFLRPATAARVAAANVDAMPDSQSWIGRYMFRQGEVATARIYVQCQPAARVIAGATLVGAQFSLVFRAPFESPADDERLGEMFRVASRAIVEVFTQLTTEQAHVQKGLVKAGPRSRRHTSVLLVRRGPPRKVSCFGHHGKRLSDPMPGKT
jgi:hypothetical protein